MARDVDDTTRHNSTLDTWLLVEEMIGGHRAACLTKEHEHGCRENRNEQQNRTETKHATGTKQHCTKTRGPPRWPNKDLICNHVTNCMRPRTQHAPTATGRKFTPNAINFLYFAQSDSDTLRLVVVCNTHAGCVSILKELGKVPKTLCSNSPSSGRS